MEFKDKLKNVRGMLLISQVQIAKTLGVSFSMINRLENGKNMPNFITEKKFEKLCRDTGIIFEGEICKKI